MRMHRFNAALIATAIASSAFAAEFPFTTTPQFDSGAPNGVDTGMDSLRLSETGSTFPVLWIANGGEDSVSRIDTDTPSTAIPDGGCETARYKTWLNIGTHSTFAGPAPSRTAVDGDGNVYVANRHFDGRPASVMKILAEGFIDRNGNGIADTSSDLNGNCQIEANEIRQHTDANGNGILDAGEINDERIAWFAQVGPNNGLGRSLCIGTDGNIWLGLFNSAAYFKINAANGAVLGGPFANALNNYGCAVDSDGKLFSANLSTTLGEFDTLTNANVINRGHGNSGANYGIALGTVDGVKHVFLASQSSLSYIDFNRSTSTFSTPADVFQYSLGISVDGNGDIIIGQNPVRKFRASDGAVIWAGNHPDGAYSTSNSRGVIPDSRNNIWAVGTSDNSIRKFRGTDGAYLGELQVGFQPYTYSDASGISFRNVTNPSGIWTIVIDGTDAGTKWDRILWNTEPEASTPAQTETTVEARVADTEADLQNQAFVVPGNGVAGLNLMGRFIQLRVTLERDNQNAPTPIFSNISAFTLAATARVCDVDADGDIDKIDTAAISRARNQTVQPGDPRDANGDGRITVSDVKACIKLCTRTSCATQ